MRAHPIPALALALALSGAELAHATALDDYVATPDPSTARSFVRDDTGPGYTAHLYLLTSLRWRSAPSEVDRDLWRHWFWVIEPDVVTTTTALLVIGEEVNDPTPPPGPDAAFCAAAVATGSVVAHLLTVPNQPLTFPPETEARVEDGIIAYSFDRQLDTGDDLWAVLLPMVKSAVAAMDAVQEIFPGGAVPIDEFVVAGMSKRGWTAYLTAAVDPRVAAIIPIVYDNLNMDEQVEHHFQTYGGYSQALADYVAFDIPARLQTPAGQYLLSFVDPYDYRDRLDSPKFLIHSTGDSYFLPDATQFYFADLTGQKHLRTIPNSDHELGGTDFLESVVAYYAAHCRGVSLPEFSWTMEGEGSLRVETVTPPSEVRLWQATDPDGRDYRFGELGAAWTSSDLTEQGGGVYVATVEPPEAGSRAFFVELVYASGSQVPYDFIFTTEVRVVPDDIVAVASIELAAAEEIGGIRLDWTPHHLGLIDAIRLERSLAGEQTFAALAQWSGSAAASVRTHLDAGAVPGRSYRYRVAVQAGGFWLVSNVVEAQRSAEVEPGATVLVAAPNPFRTSTELRFSLTRADDVSLTVYDLAGRLVRRLPRPGLGSGGHAIPWDGTDRRGRRVACGVYLVRLDGRHVTGRTTLFRVP